MDTNRQVDVGTLLGGVAQMLSHNSGNLNGIDQGNGTHGERMAQAFQVAAQAAQNSGTGDAGQALQAAAQAMQQQGRGKAASYYANGLAQAAQQFSGQKGISISDLSPFLQSFVGGVQSGNPAQQGQGTMIDALGPALSAYMQGQQQGLDPQQSAIGALTQAVTGARGTARGSSGSIDPGAASATGILGGLFSAFLPGIISAVGQGALGGLTGGGAQSQSPYSGNVQQSDPNNPLGGLGGIAGALGGLLGGSGNTGGSPLDDQSPVGSSPIGGNSTGGWWPFGSGNKSSNDPTDTTKYV